MGTGGRFNRPTIGFTFGGWLRRRACIVDRVSLCTLLALVLMLADVGGLQAQLQPARRSPAASDIIVTPDNFRRAATDLIFDDLVKKNGLGRFVHQRELPGTDARLVRPSRDTLLSMAVFDLDAGPVTITLPDPNWRFMSMYVVDEDQYVSAVHYGAGSYTLTKAQISTRYVYVGLRILVAHADAPDLKAVHALQDAIEVEQKDGPGTYQVTGFDPVSRMKVRDALFALGNTLTDTNRMFGARDQVDPVRHLIGTAIGFGSTSEKEVLNLHITPRKNDGFAIYKLNVRDVPVDGFWSVSVYNADGRFVRNALDAYTVNNIAAKKSNGSIAVQFGGCDGKIANCLPTTLGWNYLVRLYRPRPEILDGAWTFPEAQLSP